MSILVTGGAGFIGSHTCVELLNEDFDIVVIDDFSNSDMEAIKSVEKITGKQVKFYEGDVKDKSLLDKIFTENDIVSVIHFAAYKAVGESVSKPLKYYENNLETTIHLLEAMDKHNCRNIVFSSSATVYGKPETLPITEESSLSTTNPYGTTKLMTEQILEDVAKSDDKWNIVILRYFNPIGAHESGLIGENPKDIPNNLMPYIVKVATKELEVLSVFGNDYDTHDGTGVRDYIHVVDLAKGHVKSIEKIKELNGVSYFNLGTGEGYSVLDLVNTFSKVNNVNVDYKIVERRPGDIDACFADTKKAFHELGFKTTKSIEDMCRDSYQYAVKFSSK